MMSPRKDDDVDRVPGRLGACSQSAAWLGGCPVVEFADQDQEGSQRLVRPVIPRDGSSAALFTDREPVAEPGGAIGVEGDGSGEAFVLGSDLISSVNDRR
jgi:hypothetical protein